MHMSQEPGNQDVKEELIRPIREPWKTILRGGPADER